MEIKIITVGKIKEKYINLGIDEFIKRLQAFAKVSIIELKEDGNDSNREDSIKKEGILIKNILEKFKGYNILLDVDGKNISSEEMSKEIERLTVQGSSTINFIIGGSYGVSEDVRKMSNFRLSFSKMTFPHQLMRVILLEQIYRAYKINAGEPYHK